MKRQFDGDGLRALRNERGLSMKEFWKAMGYNLSRGCAYETGRTKIPEHVKRLVCLHYEAGIPTDPASEEFREFLEILNETRPASVGKARKLLKNAIQELGK